MKALAICALLLILGACVSDGGYEVAKDPKTGKYSLVFNTPKPIKKRKLRALPKKHKRKHRKLQVGAMLGGAAAGAVVGGLLSGTSGIKKQIAAIKPKVRNLKLKNLVEKDNNGLLFKANMELRKIYGDLKTMRESFVFLLEKKKDMLVEILPDVSV